jgi:hypothetical protein
VKIIVKKKKPATITLVNAKKIKDEVNKLIKGSQIKVIYYEVPTHIPA